MKISSLLIVSYFIGSIPFGFLLAWWVKKIDIRNFGSGNIGATNVFRVVGGGWGILVFILDFLKGFFPLFLVRLYSAPSPKYIYIIAALVAVCAVCGHNWSIFLKFRGGKGVATSLGVIVGLSLIFPKLWIVLALSFSVWIAVFLICRYVSLASILSALSFFILSLTFVLPKEMKVLSFLLFIFILVRHKKNIKRLLNREEKRF